MEQPVGKVNLTNQNLLPQEFHNEVELVMNCNGVGFKNLLQAGRKWLETHLEYVNELNVFPVPDGDTGTNMLMTIRAATEQLEQMPDQELSTIAHAAAQGALMGARGNSGVIFSQFLQGMARGLANKSYFTALELAHAARLGVEEAYRSVIEPVEGTILTVAREAAEAAIRSAENNRDLITVLTDTVEAAKITQANTPKLLPILKKAGVTDAGGQGLVYILEGALRFLRAEPLERSENDSAPLLRSILEVDKKAYGYDVEFLIQGDWLNVEQIRAQIDRMGRSTMVIGDQKLVKVHVHAPDPGEPISYGARQGIISQVVIENLEVQAREFVRGHTCEVPDRTIQRSAFNGTAMNIATVVVVPGQGLARIFQSLGVSLVMPGGQTLNPSTRDLLDAVSQVEAEHVLILPNNANVILSAQQVNDLSDKSVRVIPTSTIPQGIAALLAFNHQADLETNQRRMLEAAKQVQSIEVTRAVRAGTFDGLEIKAGDVIGLLNCELACFGETYDDVVIDILGKIELDIYEIVTVYFGQDGSQSQVELLADRISFLYPDLEIEYHSGGQPNYQYIISLE